MLCNEFRTDNPYHRPSRFNYREKAVRCIRARGVIVPIAELEQRAILGAIQELNGDKLAAAKLLGIGKTTLYRKLKEYGTPA